MTGFLATAQALMTLREKIPNARYRFENGLCIVEFDVDEDVPKSFDDARLMFEPI